MLPRQVQPGAICPPACLRCPAFQLCWATGQDRAGEGGGRGQQQQQLSPGQWTQRVFCHSPASAAAAHCIATYAAYILYILYISSSSGTRSLCVASFSSLGQRTVALTSRTVAPWKNVDNEESSQSILIFNSASNDEDLYCGAVCMLLSLSLFT